MAVMVRTNTFDLKSNQHLLDNTIVLTPRWYYLIMFNFAVSNLPSWIYPSSALFCL
jgi:hypothetical protein